MNWLASMLGFRLGGLSVELTMLVLTMVLGIVHIVLAAQLVTSERGLAWNISPRDGAPPPLGKWAGRLDRAQKNFMETFPFFAASVLALTVVERSSALTVAGAALYFYARVLYLPLYAFGVRVARTLVWLIGTIGIVMLIVALFCPTR